MAEACRAEATSTACIVATVGAAGLCLCSLGEQLRTPPPARGHTPHSADGHGPVRPTVEQSRPETPALGAAHPPTSSMDDLFRAQALVERLRPVALAFQEAIVRSKAESQRQLDAEGGEVAAYVRQHAAHVRNRDASLRLLRGLRVVMDVMLGADVPSDDDSWSDSDSDSEIDEMSRVTVRFRAIEREATLLEKRAQRLHKNCAATNLPGHVPTAESRQQLLQCEAAALHAATLNPPLGSTATRMQALGALVTDLRAAEASFDFQRTLMQAHQRLGSTTEYSRDNFAYGSTPWQSWIQLHTDPDCNELALAVQRCAAKGSSLPEYIVFGSSLGWLCFYAALSLSVHAVGYEIVEPLVTKAEQLRLQHCSAGDGACLIDFHCQDMLMAPLERCGILVLTSRCWDKPLASALHARLIRDLPNDAVVVDYNDDLAKASVPDSTTQRTGFEVVGSCVIPVSWDSQQHMYVMRRRRS